MSFVEQGFEKTEHDEMPVARFSSEAQLVFYEWLKALERRVRSGTVGSPAFEAHLTKYKKVMPALALIFHLIDLCDPRRGGDRSVRVGVDATELAVRWCAYLEEHAKKIYADAQRSKVTAAHVLFSRITDGSVPNRTTVRSVYRKGWTQLGDLEAVRAALSLLEEHNIVQIVEESPTGRGAPTELIYLNPELDTPGRAP